jgi:predicted dehydrogenase
MIRVGIAGIGFMGMTHFRAYPQSRGARVTAIAAREAHKRAGDWRSIKGNFGAPGEKIDLKGIHAYADWRELIADPDVDLIDVCLPPAMHAEVSIAALNAGKHVFCEKPIALELADAARMVRAAERAGRLLMIGHVLPFFSE